MELSKALAVFVEGPLPTALLQNDHICFERVIHSMKECILPEDRVYTLSDAEFDTPDALRQRLASGGPVKPI